MITILKKYILLSSLCFSFLSANAQTRQQVDSLIGHTRNLYKNVSEFEKAINNAFQVVSISEQINYEKGIVSGYLTIADILSKSGEYEKSIEYVRKVQQYKNLLAAEPIEEFHLLMLQSTNYKALGFKSLAKKYFHQAESTIRKEKDPHERAVASFYLYMSSEADTENPDSLYQYFTKARALMQSPEYVGDGSAVLDMKQDQALLSINFGDYHLTKENADSARYYYESALSLLKNLGEPNYEAYAHDGLAAMYEFLNDYPKAAEHYLRSIEILKKYSMTEYIQQEYLGVSKIYGKLGDLTKEKEYLQLYTVLTDSLEKSKSRGREMTVLELIQENENSLQNTHQRSYIFTGIFIAIVLLFLGIFYWLYRKSHSLKQGSRMNEEKPQIESAQEVEIPQQPEKIQWENPVTELTEDENDDEEKSPSNSSESFNELIEMVRNNHPNFYVRFREVYPKLQQKLLEMVPDLQLSELTLCAYIYLDFSAKDIAAYTFKSVRTVQTRKSNLRKKLGILPTQDIYLWMKDFVSENQG